MKKAWLLMVPWIACAEAATVVVSDGFAVGVGGREAGDSLVGEAVQTGEGAWMNSRIDGSSMSGSMRFVEGGGVTETVGGGGGAYVTVYQPDGSFALEVLVTPNDFTGNFTIGFLETVSASFFINNNTGDSLKYRYIMAGTNAGRFQWSVRNDGVSVNTSYSTRTGSEPVGSNDAVRLKLTYNADTRQAIGAVYNVTGGYELSSSTISVPALAGMDQVGFGWSDIPNQSTAPSANPGIVSGFAVFGEIPGLGLPVREGFEANGGVFDGPLHGQSGWVVEEGGATVLQTEGAHGGAQAVSLGTGTVSRPFLSETPVLWSRIHARLDAVPEANPVLSDSRTALAFFVDTNLNVVVFDGQAETVLPHATVALGAWTRFDVFCDHGAADGPVWSLAVDGTMVAENLGFFYPQGGVSSLRVASGGVPVLLDDVAIDGVEPVDLPAVDTDGDGLPDWWEQKYYGSAVAVSDPGQLGAQGVPLSDAYLAGLDPLDPSDVFGVMLADAPLRRLEWIRRPSRRYDVYWSPDLLEGFELIAEDCAGDWYTDTDEERTGSDGGFYRLEVRK